jgi:hypothetical protein
MKELTCIIQQHMQTVPTTPQELNSVDMSTKKNEYIIKITIIIQ